MAPPRWTASDDRHSFDICQASELSSVGQGSANPRRKSVKMKVNLDGRHSGELKQLSPLGEDLEKYLGHQGPMSTPPGTTLLLLASQAW